MSASQKEYFPFFVSQYFVTLKATREETYSFFSFMSEWIFWNIVFQKYSNLHAPCF